MALAMLKFVLYMLWSAFGLISYFAISNTEPDESSYRDLRKQKDEDVFPVRKGSLKPPPKSKRRSPREESANCAHVRNRVSKGIIRERRQSSAV
ncbi:unnamed protein product [Bursaphelenchus okinawaensis]|uniref:Uncharacterized protein n=1 Tax=Bursaphelenchus okinawaensis TaxID=465554 RepID=A0A811JW22_9BILA|nr:unnamed protein product [Bursaphelenchus okinawaensis]CAG9086490.1 unnamed protein product [Bursaphelenchus okinawaensis]